MSSVEEITTEEGVATWIDDMDFCHITEENVRVALCGHNSGVENSGPTCRDYDGEAICPDCGNPTCPRCAQLEALEFSLGHS